MRNRMYGGVRGRKTKVGEKLHRFPPTRFFPEDLLLGYDRLSFALENKKRIPFWISFGVLPGTRTLDPLIKSQLLYQLS